LEGEVMACLRNTLAAKPHKLTDTCKAQIQGVVAEAAKDVRQNPHLMKVCKESVSSNVRHVTPLLLISIM
jgi:hypothetical protein